MVQAKYIIYFLNAYERLTAVTRKARNLKYVNYITFYKECVTTGS
jgi:hypothetical protein